MVEPRRPSCGEVWRVDLVPVVGHEQRRVRPVVVISNDLFNHGPSGLAIVVPITSRDRGSPLHVTVTPPEGGLTRPSVAMCDQVRSMSTRRLIRRLGVVEPATLVEIADRVRVLLGL